MRCQPGAYQSDEGSTGCDACVPGKFTAVLGATQCTECDTGGYCPDAGAASALVYRQCPAGTYNPDRGTMRSDSCRACPAGKANPVPGSVSAESCQPCLPGSTAASGGSDTSITSFRENTFLFKYSDLEHLLALDRHEHLARVPAADFEPRTYEAVSEACHPVSGSRQRIASEGSHVHLICSTFAE